MSSCRHFCELMQLWSKTVTHVRREKITAGHRLYWVRTKENLMRQTQQNSSFEYVDGQLVVMGRNWPIQ